MFAVIILTFLSGFNGLMYGEHSAHKYQKSVIAIQLLKIKLIICVNAFSGFILSVMCTSHTMANCSACGVFVPLILLTGESRFFLFRQNYFLL